MNLPPIITPEFIGPHIPAREFLEAFQNGQKDAAEDVWKRVYPENGETAFRWYIKGRRSVA